MEATPGFEPGIAVLQTAALPLGYVAPARVPFSSSTDAPGTTVFTSCTRALLPVMAASGYVRRVLLGFT